ncbi:hypothetical protein ACOJBO_02640 [Rhizobium beringeri]
MENLARLGLTMAGEPVELLAPRRHPQIDRRPAGPLAQWDRLSPPACAAVLEYLLSDVLERVETQIGGQIALTDVGPAGTPRTAWQFRF